jgi:predicted transcriptional regulator
VNEHERTLLLSVRPRFAESILAGTKAAEIRRQRPDVAPGTLVIIYATVPVAAIIGTARLTAISQGSPREVWSSHGEYAAITRQEFDEYLSGASNAYALCLAAPQRLPVPLSLAEMRASTNFHPPQSYRYMNASTLRDLVGGHPGGESLLAMLSAHGLPWSGNCGSTVPTSWRRTSLFF